MTWIKRIDECLGKRKKYTPEQRELFAHALLHIVPSAVEYRGIAAPKNADVKEARKDLQKINELLGLFRERVETTPFLKHIDSFVSGVFQQTRGSEVNIGTIERYVHFFGEHVEDTYASSKLQRGGDITALAVCQFVCHAYERCFGERPGLNKDEETSNPYERVCDAVAERFKISLPRASQVMAVETYQRGLIDFNRLFPDDEIIRVKST